MILTSGPWLAASVAALIFVPHIVWQIRNDWPTVEFVRNATELKMTAVSPWQFFVDQLLMTHPLTLPVWLAGLWWLLREDGGRWAPLAWTFLTPLAILLLSETSRAYYLGPAYPVAFAAGAVAITRWTQESAASWLRPAIVGVLLIGGAVTAPMALPLLPVDRLIAYSDAVGIAPRPEERSEVGLLPQYSADMFGWREMVDEVATVYDGLSPEDRAKVVIYTDNYGRAAAVDFFGRARGLPRAVSGHNSYFLWGPRGGTGEVMILIGGDLEDHVGDFESVQPMAVVRCRYCMPYEDNVTIFVGRGMKVPLPALWPDVRRYI